MLGNLILFSVLLNFVLKSDVASAVENFVFVEDSSDNNSVYVRNERWSLFAPFRNMFSDIKRYFATKTEAIEENKKRIKTAFKVFLEELSRKKKPSVPGLEVDIELQNGPQLRNYSRTNPLKQFSTTIDMNTEQMITAAGYRAEAHVVVTGDGYLLTMYRIRDDFDKIHNRVVLLHHGLLGSSEDWLFLGRPKALPYILIENGYDVWLLNARGSRYSRTHTNKSPERMEFWDFSWHEIGLYDLPAAIKYVSEITDKAELNFIGHSMGATALLVLLSTQPEYNYILKSGTLLAPLAFMYHAKGPIRMLKNFYRKNGYQSLSFLGQMEFMTEDVFPEEIINKYCKGSKRSCLNPLLLLANGGKDLVDEKLMDDILAHVPAGGSVKTVMHYVQLVKSGYFQMYNYGASDNYRKYKNNTPYLYNLKHISLPIAMFSSPADWLSTVPDIQTLLPLLQDVTVHHVVKSPEFSHFDFVWSPDAQELVYNFVLSLLDQQAPKDDPYFIDL